MSRKKMLLTMTPRPYRSLVDYAHPFDLFGGRLNAFQGLFTMHSLNRPVALHLLAQNIPFPSKVLEFPSKEELQDEIRKGYDYVALQIHSNMEFRDALEVCDWVRSLSPGTEIILGGHGVTCYTEEFLTRREIEEKADYVCWGDGVGFIKDLFGVDQEVDPVLPPMEFFIEMMPEKTNLAGVIIPGVGCKNRCSFCATGHFFDGRFIKLQSPAGMYRVMEKTQRRYRSIDRFALFDELFLSRPDEVRELGEMIYNGSETNLSTVSYFTFSDFRSVSEYDPEDLVRWGVSRVFLGVESTLRRLPKNRGVDFKSVVKNLHDHGIETILSIIFGLSHHTPENIRVEMENFLGIEGVYNQVTMESPPVGTPNWKAFKLKGRIDETFPLEELHGYSTAYKHPHFQQGEILETAKNFQKRIYYEKGPAIMKALEVELNGYEFCLRSKDPGLRTRKLKYLRKSLRNQAPILWVVKERHENESVCNRAADVLDRYLDHFGNEDRFFRKKAERLLKRYDREAEERRKRGNRPYFELTKIETEYPGVEATPGDGPLFPVIPTLETVGV